MKKGLLFLASLLVSVASFAQWTSPITAADGEEVVVGEKYFLYNLGAGGFLKGANDWETRASILTTAADTVIIEEAAEAGFYRISVYAQRDNMGWRYMSCNSWDGMWIDGKLNDGGYPGTEEWKLSKAEDSNVYTISNDHVSGSTFGISGLVDGVAGNTRCFMLGSSDAGDKLSGTQANTWVFIPVDSYEDDKGEEITLYNAAFNLKNTLDAAKEKYPSLDFSAQEAVYNTTTSTTEELAAAQAQVGDIINDYLATLATFDEPFDLSESIGSNQASYRPWVRTFTGSGNVGSETWNTWSGEAPDDGTDMTNPFRETWTSGGGLLSDMKITQTLENATPGLYKLTIDARLYSESGAIDEFKGAEMFFGETRINMQEETPMTKINDTKFLLWNPHYFNIIAIVKEAGDIEFGFEFTQPNFNWLAFKNVSLKYYGNKDVEENAAKLAKAIYNFEKVDPANVAANPTVIQDYNDAVDAFDAAAVEDIKTAAAAADEAKAALEENVKAHETFYSKFDSWFNTYQEATLNGMSGPLVDDFGEFLETEEEDPGLEGYPTPAAGAIVSQYNDDPALKYPFASLEEVNTYIATVDELWANVLANSAQPGDDMTSLLKNPGFGSQNSKYDAETGKWSQSAVYNLDGWTTTTNNNVGGLNQKMCVETFGTPVDFYQTVEGAPAGLYKIETNAFVRPTGNDNLTGKEEVNCWLYMNKFESRVPNLLTVENLVFQGDELPEDHVKAVDGENCYLTAKNSADGGWWSNFQWANNADVTISRELPNGETGLTAVIPNGMIGASYAFNAGRYQVTTYGLVGDDEPMTVGITTHGKSIEWFLFAGFKLTFMGKDPVACSSVLADKWEELDQFITDNDAALTTGYKNAAKETLSKTKGMNEGNTSPDDLWNALQEVVAALSDGNANIVVGEDFATAREALETAAETLSEYNGGTETEEYSDYESNLSPKIDAWQSLPTTDAIKDLIAEMNAATEAINAKIAELDREEKMAEMATADDDNPVDCTELFIQNWNFETIENGAFPGWEFWKAKGNGPVKDGGGIDGRSLEAWSGTVGADLNFLCAQEITGLPEGTYCLSAMAANASNDVQSDVDLWYGENPAEGRAYLYANTANGVASVPVEPNIGSATEANEYMVIFKVGENETVTIGFQTKGTMPFRWFMCDNFNLQYFGTKSAFEPSDDEGGMDELVGIDGVKAGAKKFGKIFEKGQIVIYKNGKKFNVAGQAIK